jgi:hypothetical protein
MSTRLNVAATPEVLLPAVIKAADEFAATAKKAADDAAAKKATDEAVAAAKKLADDSAAAAKVAADAAAKKAADEAAAKTAVLRLVAAKTAVLRLVPPPTKTCVAGFFEMPRTIASHSIHVVLSMPAHESVAGNNKRQWILNLGQEGQKAEHWLWSPTGQFGSSTHGDIQFGGWSWGNQITSFNGESATKQRITEAKSLTTTYNAATGTYRLYMNQKLVASTNTPNFQLSTNTLNVAMLPKSFTPGGAEVAFTGCVHSVELWHTELSAEDVLNLKA